VQKLHQLGEGKPEAIPLAGLPTHQIFQQMKFTLLDEMFRYKPNGSTEPCSKM
jgi:hypothetical protein